MSTTVTSKGQVTIPKAVRDRLNIKPGNAVDFGLTPDGQVVLSKAGKKPIVPNSRFDRIRGSATTGMTTDEIMALMRGPPAEV
jgi:AbrB family looped-hinge helix DNA binding protein